MIHLIHRLLVHTDEAVVEELTDDGGLAHHGGAHDHDPVLHLALALTGAGANTVNTVLT